MFARWWRDKGREEYMGYINGGLMQPDTMPAQRLSGGVAASETGLCGGREGWGGYEKSTSECGTHCHSLGWLVELVYMYSGTGPTCHCSMT